jgi:hypothetical protein
MTAVSTWFGQNRTTVAVLVNAVMLALGAFGFNLTTLQMGAVMGVVNPVLVLLAHNAPQPS